MEIELKSTSTIQRINGQPVRVWEGKTKSGIEVVAFIAKIGVRLEDDAEEFDNELRAYSPPSVTWPAQAQADLIFEADEDTETCECHGITLNLCPARKSPGMDNAYGTIGGDE